MLSDRDHELLAAAVDDELTPRQRRDLERLLAASPEAWARLERLRSDAARLRAMPRHTLPADFPGKVLLAITERGFVTSANRPTPTFWRRLPAVAMIAAAASVMLVVSLGSVLYVVVSNAHLATPVSRTSGDLAPEIAILPAPVAERIGPRTVIEILPHPADLSLPEQLPRPQSHGHTPVAESPRKKIDDSLRTSQVPPTFVPAEIKAPSLPLVRTIAELKQDAVWRDVHSAIQSEHALRVDVFVRGDLAKGYDKFTTILSNAGHQVIADPLVGDGLKKRFRMGVALLSETLTAEEVLTLLRMADSPLEEVVVSPLVSRSEADRDRRLLLDLFGTDVASPKASRNKGLLGVDLRKPVSESTAGQLSKSLARPTTEIPKRLVVAVPFDGPVRASPAVSKEIRQYLDARGEQKTGTVPVMLVLRPMK